MSEAYEAKNAIDLPEDIVHVKETLDVILFHGYELTYKEVFHFVNKKFVKYRCDVETKNVNNALKEFISNWGLTIVILADGTDTIYEIFGYPHSTGITTEIGESLKEALKAYFKIRINYKIKYYKRMKKSLKGK